jgi:hypothetical protein
VLLILLLFGAVRFPVFLFGIVGFMIFALGALV